MSGLNIRTMRSLEGGPLGDGGTSALDDWYRSIRDIPLSDLSAADVARSCRQALFPDHVVPLAIRHLRENPLVGDLYDGELLVSLRNVDETFWRRREDLRRELSKILARLEMIDLDDETAADIEAIRKNADVPGAG
jgi:hypothetical protein